MNGQNKVLLVKPVKHIDSSPKKLTGPGWQTLGELELRTAEEADRLVRAWMTEILIPLNLNGDFLNKILRSAQEAVTRAKDGEVAAFEFDHVHLLVFAPIENVSSGKTWGFFRIEKVGTPSANTEPSDHSIEFYLYIEGS